MNINIVTFGLFFRVWKIDFSSLFLGLLVTFLKDFIKTKSMDMDAGVTPCNLEACPMVSGLYSVSFCLTSDDNALMD